MIDLLCLAVVVHMEARGEPYEGQLAVAEVVMNRTRDDYFPDEVCDVTMQQNQFSYRSGLEISDVDPMSYQAAEEVYYCGSDLTDGATYFHSGSAPYWTQDFTYTVTIGDHDFYKDDT